MELLELIKRKHGGLELSREDLSSFVAELVAGQLKEYQVAALLMAICYEGLSPAEAADLTAAMVESGGTYSWENLGRPVVDKHSTGGVGDKVSLVLIPWLAAAGLAVPKMSGRGLGHTGGTIDKLECIPGFNVEITKGQLESQLETVGCAVVAQSRDLVPADKILYALRDATDTVDELGLIASSIMSKKLAAGADCIALDVKCGNGAFFGSLEEARRFASLAISIGESAGRRVACIISNMAQPLGTAVGNLLEVQEAFGYSRGEIEVPDLQEVCLAIGPCLLHMAGICADTESASGLMLSIRADGRLWEKTRQWVSAQGGNLDGLGESRPGYRAIEVRSPQAGVIQSMDARAIGELARSLGAGRLSKEDSVDPCVGLKCHCKTGSEVGNGQVVAEITAKQGDPRSDSMIAGAYLETIQIGTEAAIPTPTVIEVIGA